MVVRVGGPGTEVEERGVGPEPVLLTRLVVVEEHSELEDMRIPVTWVDVVGPGEHARFAMPTGMEGSAGEIPVAAIIQNRGAVIHVGERIEFLEREAKGRFDRTLMALDCAREGCRNDLRKVVVNRR